MSHSQRRSLILPAVLCTFLWGCAFPAVKMGYTLFSISSDDVPGQLLFAGIRFFAAGLVTLLLGWIKGKGAPVVQTRHIPGVILLGLTQTGVQYFFFYVGMAHTTGVRGSILNATSTFFTVLAAGVIWREKEPISLRKVMGCLIGFGGVLAANLGGALASQPFSLLGDGFVLLSAASLAVSAPLTKVVAQGEDSVSLTGWQLTVGGFLLLAVGWLMGGRLGNGGWQGILLLGFMVMISSVAFSIWTGLLKNNPVSQVAVYNFLIPVFGVLLSGLCLGEKVGGLSGLAALALVCLGIVVVNGEKAPA